MRIQTTSGHTSHSPYSLARHSFVQSAAKKASTGGRFRPDAMAGGSRSQNDRRRYAMAVEERALRLVDAVDSLNLVDKLLAVETLPVTAGAESIGHPEWIRLTLEVLLSRLRSIKDNLLLLIVEVFELRLPQREVNLKNLMPLLRDQRVSELLVIAADSIRPSDASSARLTEEPTQPPPDETVSSNDRIHRDLVSTVSASYRSRADALIEVSTRLLDLAQPEFEHRWLSKHDRVFDPHPVELMAWPQVATA